MTEVLVAAAIFAVLVGGAMRTIFYNRRAADTTLRVGDLQEVRRVLTRVTQDLQQAVAIELPGWAGASSALRYLDDQYRTVTFFAADDAGTPLNTAALAALPEDATIQLLRTTEVVGEEDETVVVGARLRIRRVRFFRLGRTLLGFRMELRGNRHASTTGLRKPEVYSTVVALNRQVQ